MWTFLFKTPILNILLLFNRFLFQNLGLAIVGLTLLIRGALIPLTLPAIRSSKKVKELKPQLDGLKEKHSDDQASLAQAQMELYRQHGVNPVGGCLPILLSLPVMVALYQVLLMVLNAETAAVVNEFAYFDFLKVSSLDQLQTNFLWLNLTQADPFYILPLLVGAAQFLNAHLVSPSSSSPGKDKSEGEREGAEVMAEAMQTQFKYFFPFMTVFIAARLPAGVSLYWLASTLFGIIQAKFLA